MVNCFLNVRCNASTNTVNKKGTLGTYPPEVWNNENGMANILSMHNASKHFCLTMDTHLEDAICLHRSDSTIMKFTPSQNGLYKHALKDSAEDRWSMLTTGKQQASRYTKREFQQAKTARKFQNIVMRPGSRELMDVAIKHLCNCPVTILDINSVDDIFGPNLESLKGKTPTKPNLHVKGSTDRVPIEIMEQHKRIVLGIDIMFVNSIPFLVMVSRKQHFGTVKALPNQQIPPIRDNLRAVCTIYYQRGFKVRAVMADNEFEPLRPWLPQINCCVAKEHAPEIK